MPDLNVAVVSSTYFANASGSLPHNSMAILFNTEKQRHPEFLCWSKNASHTTVTPSTVFLAEKPDSKCNWTQYLATCDVVEGPHEFGLTAKSGDSTVVKIPYRPALNRKLNVAVCYGPLFFAERWQSLILALEVYRQYGADLQVLYVQSMLVELMDFLKVYEKEGVALVTPWTLTDFGSKPLGYDPNSELLWHNQATAHTDCLLKLKTSAEFIVFGDIDDILLPKLSGGYAKEFAVLASLNPSSAGFVYPRYNANFDTSTSPTQFSLSRMLRKTRISNKTVSGKYVVIPSRIKSAWLHKPGVVEGGFEMWNIAEEYNFVLHMRHWRSVDTHIERNPNAIDAFVLHQRQIRDILSADQIIAVESNFRSFLDRHDAYDLFQRLSQTVHYNPLMEKCYEHLLHDDSTDSHKCISPNLPTDALVDIFQFLKRRELDVLLVSSRRFCHVISSKMATVCLRAVADFYLTYDQKEGCYTLKILPTDGKAFYYHSRVDEMFSLVPKVLRSTYVQNLLFANVVLSDGLCKSICEVAHTLRIHKLELGCFDRGMVDEHLSSPLYFFDVLERFQVLRLLCVDDFRSPRTFFTDAFLEYFRRIRCVFLHNSAFTEQGLINYYFFDDKPHVANQVFGPGVDVTAEFVINFVKAAAASTHQPVPFKLNLFHSARQQTSGLQAVSTKSEWSPWSTKFIATYEFPLGEEASLFCKNTELTSRDSDERQAVSTTFVMQVYDD